MPATRLLLAYPGATDDALASTPLSELLPRITQALDPQCLGLDSQLDDDANVAAVCQALDSETAASVLVGGFSLGARIAAMASLRRPVQGVLGLSYPFHRHGRPQERHGYAVLQQVTAPCLVIQGTRDSHGSQMQVRGMPPLPPTVAVHWLDDGNHHWNCRGGRGRDHHVQDAARAIHAFISGLV